MVNQIIVIRACHSDLAKPDLVNSSNDDRLKVREGYLIIFVCLSDQGCLVVVSICPPNSFMINLAAVSWKDQTSSASEMIVDGSGAQPWSQDTQITTDNNWQSNIADVASCQWRVTRYKVSCKLIDS